MQTVAGCCFPAHTVLTHTHTHGVCVVFAQIIKVIFFGTNRLSLKTGPGLGLGLRLGVPLFMFAHMNV